MSARMRRAACILLVVETSYVTLGVTFGLPSLSPCMCGIEDDREINKYGGINEKG